MAATQFPTANTVRTESLSEMFVDAKVAAKKRKLKIGIWGDTETGKTHFALTCPEPIYIIDTERGVEPLIKKFANKDIKICKIYPESGNAAEYDPIKYLEKAEKAINSLQGLSEGTIVIDSGSDLWDWCEAYMKQQIAEQARKMCQWDWGIANDKYHQLLMKCVIADTVFVITAQPKPVYAGAGQPTGEYIADWMKKTRFWVDVLIRTEKRWMPTPGSAVPLTSRDPRLPQPKNVRYVAVVEKCRPERQFNLEIEDLTYDKLVEALKPHLWWL
jgi:hypothetical protein